MISLALHIFNPDNDLALANNNENYQAPASAIKMADDLAVLPAWWAESGDKVLVPSIGDAELYRAGVEPFLSRVEWFSLRQEPCFDRVQVWGWNPALRKRLKLWGVAEQLLPSSDYIQQVRALSSRFSAVSLLPQLQFSSLYCGESFFCTTESAIETALQTYPETILKAPYSSSGKGLRWGHGVKDAVLANWCRRILKSQGGVVVEPLYNKVQDFAMEFHAQGGVVRFVGYSLFQTDSNGAYKGNKLASNEEIEQILSANVPKEAFTRLKSALPKLLSEWLKESGYNGYLGVDMMLCCFEEAPFLRIHPCVEINLRMNMGVVARLFYDRYATKETQGTFVVDYLGDSEKCIAEDQRLQKEYPLVLSKGKIVSGYLSLVPVTPRSAYRAYVLLD